MSLKAGSQNVGTVKAVSSDYAVNALSDDGLVLDVTASGSALNISLPTGMPNGWGVLIRRNPASASNVIIGSPVTRTLSADGETLELRWDGSAWAVLERGTGSGFLVAANNLSELTATASTARANLGLGTASTHAETDFVAAADAVPRWQRWARV